MTEEQIIDEERINKIEKDIFSLKLLFKELLEKIDYINDRLNDFKR